MASQREKLAELLGDFDGFEREMKEGTRRRRELDAERIEEQKVALQLLEKKLQNEVLQRVEMQKALKKVSITCDRRGV